ncbi:oligopeptide transport ATP-binding protein AppD [Treponema primitia ZAS-2]|uniref:Oligopeptide transport ATP-binding protein AppD n=1 Tax=Treponema primitia (strain ATCC BAA-887 / DSM 12427 / ZAS-2) TaxID=545694 RepID=F5YM03_TREPZ|nr:ABC transporter ATP-binding protein [Treponema primitia]AEF85500.1 oligopeptide transport ATP-binding protein AppD [Treponema primitia ZAS-2]
MPEQLLCIKNFSLTVSKNNLRLIDRVDLSIDRGEIVGVVGESGCGKSITALSIMNLHPAKMFQTGGEILFEGQNLRDLDEDRMIKVRGDRIAMIFQEPMTSLNPVYTIGWQIAEMLTLHRQMSKREAMREALERLNLVAISSPEDVLLRYPHQLSGGMRQRVMIAMAMANNPKLLIADEPTTALDVTIQAQILDLMLELREKTQAGIMLITHNLGMVAEMCDRVTVMYAGQVVEEAEVKELFQNPKHPYTIGLMASLPRLDDERTRLDAIPGSVPAPQSFDKTACRFAPRCGYAREECKTVKPVMIRISETHHACCHLIKGQGAVA